MKKHLIFCILSLISLLPFSVGAVKKVSANPINIASRLILKQDSATIASTLEYYGYVPQPSENGYSVFHNPDGNTIQFKFLDRNIKKSYPTIQVYTNTSRSHIEKILTELDYIKIGDYYESNISKYSTHFTRCTFGSGKTVTFQRLKK